MDLSGDLPAISAYSTGLEAHGTVDEYFPQADPQFTPYGARVVVQLRRVKTKSAGGIILSESTKESEIWNTQVAKLIKTGPLAFRKRDTAEAWPEGIWAALGDFVRVPKYGGDRWSIDGADGEPIAFVVFNDHELIGKIEGDPLKVRAYVV